MRSSTAIILLGILLQVLIFIGQRIFGQLFASQPLLAPFGGSEMVVGFTVGALIDIAVGFWFIQSKQEMSRRKFQTMLLGSLAATITRLMSTLISIFLFLVFVGDRSFYQDILQDSTRDVVLLNIALVSIGPVCSSTLMGAIFGGLGGFMAKSLRIEAIEKNTLES